MTQVYKLFSPVTGLYTEINDQETLKIELAKSAYEFFLLHTHNQPYAIVTKHDDGSETWANLQGEDITSVVLGHIEIQAGEAIIELT